MLKEVNKRTGTGHFLVNKQQLSHHPKSNMITLKVKLPLLIEQWELLEFPPTIIINGISLINKLYCFFYK